MADFVQEKTGSEWMGMPIHHSVEKEPLGTAGALALAKNFLQSERVLIMNGDTWFEPDFKASAEVAEGSEFCIAAAQVPDASRYGTLEWDADERLISFKKITILQEALMLVCISFHKNFWSLSVLNLVRSRGLSCPSLCLNGA